MTEPRPIGMRIPRPYSTEEEFIQGDGLAIGRMGMILIGAPARPPGIVVRFELLLRNGEAVFRGEGKVVAHRMHSNGRQGLEVRFTRLDKHSKALVEKVLELRKAGAIAPAPSAGVPDLAESSGEPPRVEMASQPERPSQPDVAAEREPAAEPEAAAKPEPAAESAAEPEGAAKPEPEAAAGPESEEPVHEPEATVVDTRVAEIESAALAEAQPDDQHAPEPEPPVDEAPTPYMPPVTFDDHPPSEPVEAPRAAARFDAADSSAVQRLRARTARFDAVPDQRAALDRLRARVHA